MNVKYLWAIASIGIFTGGESARGIDARVFGSGVLAGLPLGLPAQGGPVVRRAGRVAATSRERRRALVPIETHRFFSPLGETSVVGGVLPQVSTLIDGAVGARALVRPIRAQVQVF